MEVVPALILELISDQYYNATDEEKVTIIRNTVIRAVKKLKPKVSLIMKDFTKIYRML